MFMSRVRPDRVEDFLAATLANARASLTEPGVLRFDVLQDQADPAHVVLVEVYRDADAPAAHKLTRALRGLARCGRRDDGASRGRRRSTRRCSRPQ